MAGSSENLPERQPQCDSEAPARWRAKVYAELFGPGFLPVLEKWITLQEKSLKRVMEYDLSRLDPASAQLHRSSAQSMEKVLQEYQALQKQLQEAGSL